MDLKRILVAVDSLNGRDAAFEHALALAKASGAELYVLHAIPLDRRFSFGAAERLKRLRTMRERAEDSGLRVQTVEQRGNPAEIIELHANARDVDLIVMGNEARPGWRRRGSAVTERVIRRTAIPTLVVASDVRDTRTSFRNVLVAVDLSPASKDVLKDALALTANEAAQLTVMHAAKTAETTDAVPAAWIMPEYHTHILEDARRTLEEVVSAVPAGIDTRVQVLTGSAAGIILEHAAQVDADLIVVGRSRGFKLLGSTALRVLRNNDRALLVVPSDAQRTKRLERQRAA